MGDALLGLRRSILYLPGSSERMMEKASSRGADVLVLDLEDGVHPDLKGAARDLVRSAHGRIDFGGSEVLIRANGLDTPWGEGDLSMIRDVGARGAILPKAEDRRTIEAVVSKLGGVPLFLMIETARGVLEVEKLSAWGVHGLLFGAADYRESMRAGRLPDELELLYARSRVVHAARASGIEAFDSPWFEYKDLEGLESSASRARALGFDGKTAIHPDQVPTINRVFSPTAEEIERARGIVEVMEKALVEGRNVATLGQEMVEALHLKEARRILARSGDRHQFRGSQNS
jgi:citrate lyase subunit beta/citryl-CoA lyase